MRAWLHYVVDVAAVAAVAVAVAAAAAAVGAADFDAAVAAAVDFAWEQHAWKRRETWEASHLRSYHNSRASVQLRWPQLKVLWQQRRALQVELPGQHH